MNSKSVYNRIKQFFEREETISVRRLRSITLANKNIPFRIWGETLDNISYSGREVFTFAGPSRINGEYAVGYNYNAKGYMIMYDMSKGDYRTFVYDKIYKLEINGKIYNIN
jgi:hypothetical protein